MSHDALSQNITCYAEDRAARCSKILKGRLPNRASEAGTLKELNQLRRESRPAGSIEISGLDREQTQRDRQ